MLTARFIKKLWKNEHRMSLLVDYISQFRASTTVKQFNEIPTGVINGSNKVFELAHLPVGKVALTLYPAIRLHPNDFTITSTTITLVEDTDAPVDDECLIADYEYLKTV